ncbi:MAG: PIN domain nuclease [Oscillospiraceae bacterium]|jgi:predicted nucleic acid-binding protein|nr:PIN domain nuclease [Oscillospiraceae bacterium]
MILVDTSVLIDAMRRKRNPKSDVLKQCVESGVDFGFSAFTMQEILQGCKTAVEYYTALRFFRGYTVLYPEPGPTLYACAALMFASLRQKGVTIRSPIDTLIAATAILHDIPLLHNDRDFDAIAAQFPALRILEG